MTFTMRFQLKKSRERYRGEIKRFVANIIVTRDLYGH
jgi:hypothetical protein